MENDMETTMGQHWGSICIVRVLVFTIRVVAVRG